MHFDKMDKNGEVMNPSDLAEVEAQGFTHYVNAQIQSICFNCLNAMIEVETEHLACHWYNLMKGEFS